MVATTTAALLLSSFCGIIIACGASPAEPPACPGGWVQVDEEGADIPGCGIDSCDARYNKDTIEDCAAWCAADPDHCASFTWALEGGDRNHDDQVVCTRYDQASPTALWQGSDGFHQQIFCVPLACPGGWVQVDEEGADIPGCGIDACDARYNKDTIEDCAAWCAADHHCASFTWALEGGDQNHDDQVVCTRYDQTSPTALWRGSDGSHQQIFCVPGTQCADECHNTGCTDANSCSCPGGVVSFGADCDPGHHEQCGWVTRTVSDKIECSNAAFQVDPAMGWAKTCRCAMPEDSTPEDSTPTIDAHPCDAGTHGCGSDKVCERRGPEQWSCRCADGWSCPDDAVCQCMKRVGESACDGLDACQASMSPTPTPTSAPSSTPTASPTMSPTVQTNAPTSAPTRHPCDGATHGCGSEKICEKRGDDLWSCRCRPGWTCPDQAICQCMKHINETACMGLDVCQEMTVSPTSSPTSTAPSAAPSSLVVRTSHSLPAENVESPNSRSSSSLALVHHPAGPGGNATDVAAQSKAKLIVVDSATWFWIELGVWLGLLLVWPSCCYCYGRRNGKRAAKKKANQDAKRFQGRSKKRLRWGNATHMAKTAPDDALVREAVIAVVGAGDVHAPATASAPEEEATRPLRNVTAPEADQTMSSTTGPQDVVRVRAVRLHATPKKTKESGIKRHNSIEKREFERRYMTDEAVARVIIDEHNEEHRQHARNLERQHDAEARALQRRQLKKKARLAEKQRREARSKDGGRDR